MKVDYLCKSWQFMLQQIVYLTGKGYYYYFVGLIPEDKASKAKKIDKKIIDKYDIDLSKYQRNRRKQKKLANFYYLRWRNVFVVLHTDGDIMDDIKEKMDDEFFDIRVSQKGKNRLTIPISNVVSFNVVMHSNKAQKRTVTVVYSNSTFKEFKEDLDEILKYRSLSKLKAYFDRLAYFPAWAGIIKQNKLLLEEVYKLAKKYGLNTKNKRLIKYPKEYPSLQEFPYQVKTFREIVTKEYSNDNIKEWL